MDLLTDEQFMYLSRNRHITPAFVEQYIDKSWAWGDKPSDYVDLFPWVKSLSSNPAIPIEFVINHLDKPWDWTVLTHRMPLDTIDAHPDLPWDWSYLSEMDEDKKPLDTAFVRKYRHKPWEWYNLMYEYYQLDYRLVLEQFGTDDGYTWEILSGCRDNQLSEAFVEQTLDKPWNFSSLSTNRNISIAFMEKYPALPWKVEKSPNLTLSYLFDNPDMLPGEDDKKSWIKNSRLAYIKVN